jgi:hypothetical protein
MHAFYALAVTLVTQAAVKIFAASEGQTWN